LAGTSYCTSGFAVSDSRPMRALTGANLPTIRLNRETDGAANVQWRQAGRPNRRGESSKPVVAKHLWARSASLLPRA